MRDSRARPVVVAPRVRLRVYFTNNPPAPSRDKSFLEFYLVIEFPCAWAQGVTLTLGRYAARQVARRADAVQILVLQAFTLAEIDRARYLCALRARRELFRYYLLHLWQTVCSANSVEYYIIKLYRHNLSVNLV
jgi:uracil-DNA glycosylase